MGIRCQAKAVETLSCENAHMELFSQGMSELIRMMDSSEWLLLDGASIKLAVPSSSHLGSSSANRCGVSEPSVNLLAFRS